MPPYVKRFDECSIDEQYIGAGRMTILEILFNTAHWVELKDGEQMQYVYDSQFLSGRRHLYG